MSAYAGEFEGLSPYFGAHAKAAKEAKEYRMGVRVPRLRDPACAGDFYPRLRDTLTREFLIREGIAHVTAFPGRAHARKGREAPTKSGPIERFRLEWLSDPIG